MSERDLSTLLHDVVGEPPVVVDTDNLLAVVRRRRATRLGITAAAAALILVAGVAAIWLQLSPTTSNFAIATPSANSSVQPSGPPPPGATPTAASVGKCPKVRFQKGLTVDYAPLIILGGHEYMPGWEKNKPETVGQQLTSVSCSIYEATNGGQGTVSTPWPDGTSTLLPVGTPIYLIPGTPSRCAVAVQQDGQIDVYTALDPDADPMKPLC